MKEHLTMLTDMIMLESVKLIAIQAGEEILRFHRTQKAWLREKPDGSPVTEADMASESLISAKLLPLDSRINYLSEESKQPPYAERKHWKRFWLVDPLDGTKEYVRGTNEFTVNIALIEEGEPTLGVVVAPALSVLYCAVKGYGAWKQPYGQSAKRLVSRLSDPSQPIRIVESRSHPSPELELFLSTYNVKARLKVGSSLKFCLLAEGSVDVYPRLAPTMEWDVGAGDCIYRYSAQNKSHPSSLTYNKPSLRNDSFVLGLQPGKSSTLVSGEVP